MFSFPHMSRILFCDFCSDEDVGASRKPPSPLPGGRVQSRWGATVGQGPGGALGRHHLLSSGVVVTLTTPSLQPGDVAGQVGQLSLFAACRGHSGRAQRHFPEQGGGETPRNVVSICSTVNPPLPLGNHRVGVWPIGGRPPLQGGQGQWLSAPAGFARVLRCSTEYKLPAVGAMPGHSPGLEHSPSNQGRGELRPAAFAPELCEPSSSGRSELPSGGSINKPALCLSVSESCRVFLRRRSASRLWASCRLQPAGPARSSR